MDFDAPCTRGNFDGRNRHRRMGAIGRCRLARQQPIRMIVPLQAGSAVDIVARLISTRA